MPAFAACTPADQYYGLQRGKLWAYGSGNGNALLIYTEGGDSGPISPAQQAITLPASRWTQVIVPLSALGNPALIKRINIQERAGAAAGRLFIWMRCN